MNSITKIRTNKFKVKSVEDAKIFTSRLCADYCHIEIKEDNVFLSFSSNEDLNFKTEYYEDYDDIDNMYDDMEKSIQEILTDDGCCLLYEIMYEGLRSLDGIATIITKNNIYSSSLSGFVRNKLNELNIEDIKL